IGASGVVVGDVAVALDGAGVAGTGLIGALAVLAQGTALAQVVPGLVELDFELLEAGVLLGAEAGLALVAMEQLLLLANELVDAAENLLVVPRRKPTSAPTRPIPRLWSSTTSIGRKRPEPGSQPEGAAPDWRTASSRRRPGRGAACAGRSGSSGAASTAPSSPAWAGARSSAGRSRR